MRSSNPGLFNWGLGYFQVQEPWAREETRSGDLWPLASGLFLTHLDLTSVAPLRTYWGDILFGGKTQKGLPLENSFRKNVYKRLLLMSPNVSLMSPNVSSSYQVAGQALLLIASGYRARALLVFTKRALWLQGLRGLRPVGAGLARRECG